MKRVWPVALVWLMACESDNKMSDNGGNNNPPPVTTIILKTGTFTGQNGYTTAGMTEVLRDTTTTEEFLHTLMNFTVSGGAGTIGIYLTDATGAANLNNSSNKLFLGNITSGFAGEYTFDITPGLGSYTHVVTFCVAAQVNFGNAALVDP